MTLGALNRGKTTFSILYGKLACGRSVEGNKNYNSMNLKAVVISKDYHLVSRKLNLRITKRLQTNASLCFPNINCRKKKTKFSSYVKTQETPLKIIPMSFHSSVRTYVDVDTVGVSH